MSYGNTPEQWLEVVTQNGLALRNVPFSLKTAELCLAAVQTDEEALEYVPESLQTPALCLAAVQKDGRALAWLPEDLHTPALCQIAIQQDGRALAYVPERLKTAELCRVAVQQNGWTLRFVPEHLKTAELCQVAVTQDERALEYVPEELKKGIVRGGEVRANVTTEDRARLQACMESPKNRPQLSTMMEPKDLGYYMGMVASGPVTAELEREQKAVILKAHDHGVRGLNAAELRTLDTVMDELKQSIWP